MGDGADRNTVTDPDGVTAGTVTRWHLGALSGPQHLGGTSSSGAEASQLQADGRRYGGTYLRVTATYTDGHGSGGRAASRPWRPTLFWRMR